MLNRQPPQHPHLLGRCTRAEAPPLLPFNNGVDELIHLLEDLTVLDRDIFPGCIPGGIDIAVIAGVVPCGRAIPGEAARDGAA